MIGLTMLLIRIKAKLSRYKYRQWIRGLIAKGLVLGKNVTIMPGSYIDPDYAYFIRIGDNCSISTGVRLLAHDVGTYKSLDGHTRLGKIEIRNNVFIGENAIILPSVTIGPNVLVAVGSVVNKDIPPNSCAAGNPARFYSKLDDFLKHRRDKLKERTIFEYSQLARCNLTEEVKRKVREAVEDDVVYVKGFTGSFPYTVNPW